MTQISPKVEAQFNSLSKELRQAILEKNVKINSLQDLINCLETIANQ